MSEHEHEHHEAGVLAGISEEDHERWHRFMDAVNEVANEHFPESEGGASLVFGGQFGGLGADGAPSCIIASNLVPCGTVQALEDMLALAERSHDEFHGRPHHTVEEDRPAESVPEAIRAQAEKVAEMLGLPLEAIRYVEVADIDDLHALPSTLDEAAQE